MMSNRSIVFSEQPETARLHLDTASRLKKSDSILSSTLGNSFSTRIDWISQAATNGSCPQVLRERNHALVERRLLALAKLPDEVDSGDIRPTKLALAHAFRLVDYLEKAGLDLAEMQIVPTDNHTIEFSLRRDRDNELSFETGNNGITGNMYIQGRRIAANAFHVPMTQQEHIITFAGQYRQTVN